MFDTRHIFIILALLSLLVGFFWSRSKNTAPEPGHLIKVQAQQLGPIQAELLALINAINNKNSRLRTFTCEDISIRIRNKITLSVNARIYYEKDRRLRMYVNSFVGKELDIGSNNTHFWFWSRRMDPPALYYADYDNLKKTRLKTPFHPVWMKGILGFDKIPDGVAYAQRRGKNWEILQPTRNVQGHPIIRSFVIDPEKLAIVGHYIYERGKLTVSAEVFEHRIKDGFFVPSKMVVKWYKEDISMILEFGDVKLNKRIHQNFWVMPQMHNKIDMANVPESVSFTETTFDGIPAQIFNPATGRRRCGTGGVKGRKSPNPRL